MQCGAGVKDSLCLWMTIPAEAFRPYLSIVALGLKLSPAGDM